MAENKKQHYVPQHYLKLFSNDGQNISSYHLQSEKSIRMAVKNTCQCNYFYGSDLEFESSLSSLEQLQASVIKKIITDQSLSNLVDEDYFHLLQFLLLQNTRTKQMKSITDASIDELFKDHLIPRIDPLIDPDSVKVSMKDSHFMPIGVALMGVDLISDLSLVLVFNNTDKEFITSDAPVVLYNHVKLKNKALLGFQSSGLQIYCPLNKNLLLLLIDTEFYNLNLDTESTIHLEDTSDIDAINKLQFFNCLHTVIYSDNLDMEYLTNLHTSIKDKLTQQKRSCSLMRVRNKGDQNTREIIELSTDPINYHLKLSFLKLDHGVYRIFKHDAVKKKKEVFNAVFVRDHKICDIVNTRIDKKFEEKRKEFENK